MEGGRWRSDWEKIIPRLKRPPVPRKEVYSVVRWHWRQSADPWPPGGELRHEGPLHRGQGQIPDPRLQMQFVRQAGVRGPGGRRHHSGAGWQGTAATSTQCLWSTEAAATPTMECSLFYSKRFCLPCVQENMDAFPQEIQQDLEKRKVPSKRPASQLGSRT
ncbi:cysteine-rich DPF motif domain-containing protein 1 isoform X10 [Camelus ferus]|uniref:Cysteine-rich DPF motif domain-containing protein 1 n=1 Tax=Camelus ferus TaxID=419612 RepID=A0A8B8U2D3_CAMFR|nr:cysteine-rich DPF motif domain-containing protein 1 isoform X10 [Camelus ferus]